MQSAPINLNHVRKQFNRSERIEASEFISREIGRRMAERLLLVRLDPEQILDAGCGSGADHQLLHTMYPQAQIIGVDASQELLQRALTKQSTSVQKLSPRFYTRWFSKIKDKIGAKSNVSLNSSLINGDFCRIPLANQAMKLLWSNLALHWHPEPDQVFKEWQRILKIDGLLMFSCFGPDSLKEIRHAFKDIDQTPHTLPFVDMHDFGDMLVHAGFATPVMDMEVITLTYASVKQLLAEVRSLGGNPLQTRSRGLTGKIAWQTMCNKLEQLRRADGRIPLTLEVIYGHAFKAAPRQNKPHVTTIKFDRLKNKIGKTER
ncbi:MAG: bioC [Solimicrobium sp.]|jgi:malonyl-CoA O-methyltransferase|nr:bioC [Solimicrobium sp.]